MEQLNLFNEQISEYMNEMLNWTEPLTPVEQKNGRWYKREDKFKIFDVCGAKARQAYYLISNSKKRYYCHLRFKGIATDTNCR